MSKRILFLLLFAMTSLFILAGCGGSDGSDGANGTNGTNGVDGTDGADAVVDYDAIIAELQAQLESGAITIATYEAQIAELQAASKVSNVESCAVCHSDIAGTHEVTAKNILTVSNVTGSINTGTSTVTISFHVDEDGSDYTAGFQDQTEGAYSVNAYTAYLDSTSNDWVRENSITFASTSGGVFTPGTTNPGTLDETDAANGNYVYTFAAGAVAAMLNTTVPNRLVFYARVYRDTNGDGSNDTSDFRSFVNAEVDVTPVAGVGTGTAADAKDLVPNSACFKCHDSNTYIAHGGRADAKFCVVCHNSTNVSTEASMVNMIHGIHNSDENGGYSWSTHSFDIGYPQSMSNCATCHDNSTDSTTRLSDTLAETNFTPALCKTCHGGADNTFSMDNFTFPSDTVKSFHTSYTEATNCQLCHSTAGGAAPTLAEIHDGTDAAIERGSNIEYFINSINVTTATDSTKTLTVKWGARNKTTLAAIDVTNTDADAGPVFMSYYTARNYISDGIRLLVGYYGYGTNDVAAYDAYTSNNQIQPVTTYASGVATTVVTLSDTKIDTNSSDRGVVAIIGIPLIDGKNSYVTSITQDFTYDNSAVTARDNIVNKAKCDSCHNNIAIHLNEDSSGHGHTTIGEVDACVICHNPSSAAGHYAQQSRSLKSYIHAIHVEQPTKTAYGSAVIEYPNNIQRCEVCHDAGTYEVPAQSKSLGAVVGGFDGTTGMDAVTGPAATACGSCHKGYDLANSDTDSVTALNAHTKTFGYRVLTADMTFNEVLDAVFELMN